jgi:hypothetical protein
MVDITRNISTTHRTYEFLTLVRVQKDPDGENAHFYA